MTNMNNTSDDIIKATTGSDPKDHKYEVKEEEKKEVKNTQQNKEDDDLTNGDKTLFILLVVYTICLICYSINHFLEIDNGIINVLSLVFIFMSFLIVIPIGSVNIINIIIRRKETMGLNILSLIILIIGTILLFSTFRLYL